MRSVCSFCGGKPVGNAASWVDGKPRPPAPCPRCGETNVPLGAGHGDAYPPGAPQPRDAGRVAATARSAPERAVASELEDEGRP